MMQVLILALGLSLGHSLRIQAKKKSNDAPTKIIEAARRISVENDALDKFDGDADAEPGAPKAYNGGITSKEKEKMLADAMKECTPENSAKLAQENPVTKAPLGHFEKSALPTGSFYASQAAQHMSSTMGCSGTTCQLPVYLAPREVAQESQTIPRILWMTISDELLAGKTGVFQYNLMAEHFKQNPEYEWVVSGDAMCAAFMKSDEVKKEWQDAYLKARNGAEKADIWRYAVLYKYGGVYMDADMTAHAPYRTFIDPTAQVVQQVTRKGGIKKMKGGDFWKYETSQYALFFAPGHKLLEETLDSIAQKLNNESKLPSTLLLTGPAALGYSYKNHNPCGMQKCDDTSPSKVCGLKLEETCEVEGLGKVVLLIKERDFNTGKVWHKSDVCAMSETRAKVAHWTEAPKK